MNMTAKILTLLLDPDERNSKTPGISCLKLSVLPCKGDS